MDFSEKDAARSKWKLSRKHQSRGRGHGRGGGRGAPRQASTAAALDNNYDRYESGDDDVSAAPLSQGADLADWLQQFPSPEATYHARQRVNLAQDVGLPPAEPDAFQGLSFDLKGLAACLAARPLSQVLRLPASLSCDEPPAENGPGGEHGIQGVVARLKVEDSSGTEGEKHAPGVRERRGDGAAAVQALPQPREQLFQRQAPLAGDGRGAPPVAAPAPVAAASKPPSDDLDVELEELLGLGAAKPAAQPAAFLRTDATKKAAGEPEESLEDWLDAL